MICLYKYLIVTGRKSSHSFDPAFADRRRGEEVQSQRLRNPSRYEREVAAERTSPLRPGIAEAGPLIRVCAYDH
jgi:hypothetical protein